MNAQFFRKNTVALAIGLVGLVGLGATFYHLSNLEDLNGYFVPAAREMLRGGNPYDVSGFYGPPWALIPALLLSWLPWRWAAAIHGPLTVVVLLVFCATLKVKPIRAIPMILSVPVLGAVYMGNLDPFLLLAVVTPRPVGVILLATKPQVGGFLILLWTIEAYRDGGLKAVIRLLSPTLALSLSSIILYGFWPAVWFTSAQTCAGWNHNMWNGWVHIPIIGIPLAALALWKRRNDLALGVGPFLSPYASVYAFTAWLPAMATWPTWVAWVFGLATWALVLKQLIG